MLQVESSSTLADLSRNASVISSSSDSESIQDVPSTPRPRPTRTFSSPRSRSPQSAAMQPIRPPSYLTYELGVSDRESAPYPARSYPFPRSQSRKRSRSRNPSANNRPSAQDFTFLSTLGEGSYSSVCCLPSAPHFRSHLITRSCVHSTYVLDKTTPSRSWTKTTSYVRTRWQSRWRKSSSSSNSVLAIRESFVSTGHSRMIGAYVRQFSTPHNPESHHCTA